MPLTIHWSDCLEKLAETMFAQPAAVADPFAVEGVVVGGAVIEGWLKQRYLLDRPAGGRARPLLANREFVPLHPFVNDWLAKAVEGTPLGRRDPSGIRAMPEASFILEIGQWQMPVRVFANKPSSSSLKWIPCAYHTSLPTQPSVSIYASGRRPAFSSV